ncbi:MAG: FtsX-like permease family protein, partial [Candidatus Solibacter sp.]
RGTVTDIFLPMMMHKAVTHSDWTWFRSFAMVHHGAAIEPIRAKLHATSRAFEEERAKGFTGMSKESIARFLDLTVAVDPAPAGASDLQEEYRQGLLALSVVVVLVLLIACANVANLMTAQAAARAREMALRVSIGAGKWRIVQLVLVESACLAILASAIGAVFAAWSAPYVIGQINPPDNPARLDLPLDWRVLTFSLALTLGVMVLLGVVPALRASSVRPASALKGGQNPHGRQRLMHGLIAAQVAFCFIVLFVAGLFGATFDRLSHRPMGFAPDRLLAVDAVTVGAQPPVYWEQVAQHLRTVPGVERVALAGWPLLAGRSWNGFVSINGAPPGPVMAYFLNVSAGWVETMRLELVAGHDLQPGDTAPGAAIVNQAFVKQFCAGINPLGVQFAKQEALYKIIGVVRDAPYENIRDSVPAVVYVPLATRGPSGMQPVGRATFMVRTASANPLALAATLRREVGRARSEFRVSNISSQLEIVEAQTVRERLLAVLALFFAGVALLLAAIGLYGVLDYGVQQRRREIGIRMAIGAQAGDIARRITAQVFTMVGLGAVIGIAVGMAAVRYVEALLYEVRGNDPWMLAAPGVAIVCAALLASIPAVRRAVRIDPAETLRGD